MTSNKKATYDEALLTYYYDKSSVYLAKTEDKYKKYAETIASKCEALKQQIDVLYHDYREAHNLFVNSRKLEQNLIRDQAIYDKTSMSKRYDWCPISVQDEDDIDKIVEEQMKISSEKEMMAGRDVYMTLINPFMTNLKLSLPQLHRLVTNAVPLKTQMEANKVLQGQNNFITKEHKELKEKSEQLQLIKVILDTIVQDVDQEKFNSDVGTIITSNKHNLANLLQVVQKIQGDITPPINYEQSSYFPSRVPLEMYDSYERY